ncbi:hypothetical protein LAG90_14930 [Marinilongibacter aquaticus]|uniref:DUF6252 family protein n=1 Tax=Marinilongibacter aquaticus TaxID=2975157 RepID=UPI0021BDD147|nr:DUF6252 family protein [Marinilongibacter aquaticus]UBM58098.1 hypothetical protein LAG90_14930 [Marinilongibacter aquaticus]
MKKILFTLILSLALQSCDWIKSLGPEETFFCKINGQKFRPDKDNSPIGGWGSKPLRVEYNKGTKILFISVRNSPKVISLVILLEDNVLSLNEFSLSNDSLSSKGYFTPDNGRIPLIKTISSRGRLEITKIEGYNISGTFEFVCKDSTNNKEYHITEGEFNKLSYY